VTGKETNISDSTWNCGGFWGFLSFLFENYSVCSDQSSTK